MLADDFLDLRVQLPYWAILAAAVAELFVACLAAYCLAINAREVAWSLLTLAFGFLILVSFVRYCLGIEACGCFGAYEFPSWVSLAVALTSFLLLVVPSWLACRSVALLIKNVCECIYAASKHASSAFW